jgi:hypothetical protein
MKKKRILLVLALVAVTGCVDTPDSVCREFRNANNEHIDALMMVTSEAQAKKMTVRVFSQMSDRYKLLDKKWDIMETNWGRAPDFDAIKSFLESDGLHLYRAEYRANAQRCSLELARLRNLLNQLVENAKQKARDEGGNPDEVVTSAAFPALHALVNAGNTISVLRGQMESPRLETLLTKFNGRLDVEKLEGKAVLDNYKKKYKTFCEVNENRPIIILVRN